MERARRNRATLRIINPLLLLLDRYTVEPLVGQSPQSFRHSSSTTTTTTTTFDNSKKEAPSFFRCNNG
ncbi:hypothetical protein GHT06_021172 [Daphnia sinensis]|uniref:Uncharacterized protein n=1 Tax=Daphnia sinensis TaxID=1820382 RepID=A0AAD5PMQ0_9CRUS|nr:hypothetical protein GHT06_021172 [Daphnia sinensis]